MRPQADGYGHSPDKQRLMLVVGEISPPSFEQFVRVRAQLLDLALRIESLGRAAALVTVAGQRDLVDAFEMACALGPSDCLVDSVLVGPVVVDSVLVGSVVAA